MQLRLWGGEDPPRPKRRRKSCKSEAEKKARRRERQRIYQKKRRAEDSEYRVKDGIYKRDYYRKRCAEDSEFHERCKELRRAYHRKQQAQNPEYRLRRQNAHFQRTYGLTPEQKVDLLSMHDGRCSICNEFKPLFVDHSRKSGKVRGPLCRECNFAVGLVHDNPEIALRLYEYLSAHEIDIESLIEFATFARSYEDEK